MRVLVLPKEFPSAARPGQGIFILRRCQALRDLGHDLEILRIVPMAPPFGAKWDAYREIPAVEDVDGFAVRTIRALIPPRMIGMEYLPLQVHRAVEREIARFRPDLLHASFIIPCGQIAVRHAVPAVVTAHGVDAYGWPKRRAGLYRAAREAIARATRVTAVSGFIARCLESMEPRPVDVIWNGGDERFFFPRDRAQARAEEALPPDRPLVAFVGNLLRAKGVYELLEAAAAMRDLNPVIAIAGAGPERDGLERRAAELRVDLRLLGRLDSPRVARLYAAADVVTLPSYNEGLPNVVCEAMLSGRAVAATTVGGIPEIVQHEETGLLVPPADAAGLGAALRRVLQDDALRLRLERNARAFAERRLTWRISAQGYDRVYRESLGA